MPDITFSGQVAIVTGAGGGLGRAYAFELARRGARVVVNDIVVAQPVVDAITAAGGEAVANADSVATAEGGRAIVQAALDAFGTVDVLINNAGITRDRSFSKLSQQELESVVDVHLLGAFHVTQPAFTVMREKAYGRLLFVTSAAGLFGNFGQTNYAAAKMGVVGLARTLAIEGARYGILSNVIAPLAQTPMTDGQFGGVMEAFDTDFVVPMVTYLVSEQSSQTSEIYSVGGGRFASAVVGVTHGWIPGGAAPSAEELAEHLDEIRGREGLVFPASAIEEIELARSLV